MILTSGHVQQIEAVMEMVKTVTEWSIQSERTLWFYSSICAEIAHLLMQSPHPPSVCSAREKDPYLRTRDIILLSAPSTIYLYDVPQPRAASEVAY